MALPARFANPKDFFEECIAFLREYKYLYTFPNTDVLVQNVFDQLQLDVEKIEVFEKTFKLKLPALDILNNFFLKLERLKPLNNEFKEISTLENFVKVPLSPKKRHEIVYVAKEVKNVCEDNGCDVVVDFGSGLGYLDQLIFETSDLKVLGLECNTSHYVGAKKRQSKYHSNSTDNVKYIKHTINEKSNVQIENYLTDKFPKYNSFCIAGLHACADLTIIALDLFLKIDKAKAIVIMPCCYHKMEQKDIAFKSFPLSKCLKHIFEEEHGFEFMNVPFLRLGSQPPCLPEDNLEDSVFNLLARAVLQLYASKHNYKLRRNKRKAVKTKSIDRNFDTYVLNARTGFSLTHNNEVTALKNNNNSLETDGISIDLDELRFMWREFASPTVRKKAAIFILLQHYLQPVIENLILYDRIVYLKERGLKHCKFKRIVDEGISPRCLALIALK